MNAMSWGEVELEPEVRDWYLGLHEEAQGRGSFHIDRLAEVDRARRAMEQCIREAHTTQGDD